MFTKLARNLEHPDTSELELEESKSVFNKIVDWCITNWYVLATNVAEEKINLDIFKEIQEMNSQNQKD